MPKKDPVAGDKCPRCREGLLERDQLGLVCNDCGWNKSNDELVRQEEARQKVDPGDFRPRKISIILDDPEKAEHFLQGLIVARSNNSSEYFEDLIDGVNEIMQPYRLKRLQEEAA